MINNLNIKALAMTGGLACGLSPTVSISATDMESDNFLPHLPKVKNASSQISALLESKFQGYGRTGSMEFPSKDTEAYIAIGEFASKIMKDQSQVPEEFEEVFQKNFWDILA